MSRVIVRRNMWRCGCLDEVGNYSTLGVGTGKPALLNDEGYMCCLGFACEQIGGVPRSKLLNAETPSELNVAVPPLSSFSSKPWSSSIVDSRFALEAMDINDSDSIYQRDREGRLIMLFEEYGITLEFVGEYE